MDVVAGGSMSSRDTTLTTTNGKMLHLCARSVASQVRLLWTIKSSWWEASVIIYRFRIVRCMTPQQIRGACSRQNCVSPALTRPSPTQEGRSLCSVELSIMGLLNVTTRIKKNGQKSGSVRPQCCSSLRVLRCFQKRSLSS